MPTTSRMGSSTISLGLGLGGGKSATSSGRAGGGGVFSNVRAVNFDGTDDYMKCDNNFATMFRSSFSVSFWIKFNDTSGTQVVLGSSNATSADRIQFFHTGSALLTFYEANNVGTVARNSGSQTWTNWNHIVTTYEQSGSSCADVLYVNGSSVANGSKTLDMSAYATTGTAPNFLVWAARALATSIGLYSNVKLDEMAFFGSALSASDVSTIYNSGVPADLSSFSPAHWWRMGDINGGLGTTIADQGSGSVDGELINGPTYITDIPS